MKAELYFDGACGPTNPGHCSYGYVIKSHQGINKGHGGCGDGTCNIAEYHGLIRGLERAKELGFTDLIIYGDSKLICNQVTGEWKCKKPHLAFLCLHARQLIEGFDSTSIQWIPRELNTEADELSTIYL